MRKTLISILAISLTLSGCSGGKTEIPLEASGARTAAAIMHLLAQQVSVNRRPSATMGIFSGIFTSQGVFLPVKSAILGFETQQKILEGFARADTDENYALLLEVGNILQVDIIDTLNRSANRRETLDTYIQSLRNTGILLERKIGELEMLLDEVQNEVREQKKLTREIEKIVKKAVKDQDYAVASEKEQELQTAKADLAEMETKAGQTEDMLGRFRELYGVAAVRLQAMDNNREILIAGLKVIEVPGIKDLGILEQGKSYKTRGRGGDNIFLQPQQIL
ncbi:hypothetical protein FJZ28_02225 [Candidatus Peregrinibacteria bacterium]|nr:hypothetical protein [Candidatus Peregrinibacteria bacterium]